MMKPVVMLAALLAAAPIAVRAQEGVDRSHVPVTAAAPVGMALAPGFKPPFSSAVVAGQTVYVSGTTDVDPHTGKLATTPEQGAQVVLDNVKRAVEAAGLSMDDLVWVQVFCSDLSNFQAFNKVYVTYFKGPLPARAFLGVDHLLGGAHYEVMGVAVKPASPKP